MPFCNWTPWTDWSNCSNACGPELKRRTRKCIDYQGNFVEESFCSGSYIETSVCECKKLEWSDWFVTEINANEIIEQRNELLLHENNVMPKNEKRVVTLKHCAMCDGYTYRFKERDFTM